MNVSAHLKRYQSYISGAICYCYTDLGLTNKENKVDDTIDAVVA